jgi:hypothetical protein
MDPTQELLEGVSGGSLEEAQVEPAGFTMKRHGPEEVFDRNPLFDPPHNGTPTSKAAAQEIRHTADNLRARVYEFIALCGENGATREECEIGLEMPGSTVRPRVVELMKAGKVREVPDVTRATESGRQAAILVATHLRTA